MNGNSLLGNFNAIQNHWSAYVIFTNTVLHALLPLHFALLVILFGTVGSPHTRSRPDSQEVSVFVNPCLGDVHIDENRVPTVCNPMGKEQCLTGYFCLPGDPATKNSSYCCSRINQEPCDSSWSEGEGDDSLDRFYYNPVEGDCYPFKYKGRKGNENNFLTKKLCQEKCKPITTVCFGGELPLMSPSGRVVQCYNEPCPDNYYCHHGKDIKSTVCCEKRGSPCDQQLMLGVGDASLPRFYYDLLEDTCLPFNYTGIGGNENNFATKAQCLIRCPGYNGYCPHGKPHIVGGVLTKCGIDTYCPANHVCHVTKRDSSSICCPDPAQFCVLERDSGPCNGNQTRYGYDRKAGVCRKFPYGGCQGNLNNFSSLQQCTEICCDKGFR